MTTRRMMASKKLPPRGNISVGRGLSGPKSSTFIGRRIYVTQEMIDEAIRNNSGHCMVADAIKAAIPEARMVTVDLQTIRWSNPLKRLRYMVLTPRSVQVYIVNWDLGNKPAPFSFVLREAQVAYMGGTKFDRTPATPVKRKRHEKVKAKHIPRNARLELRSNGSAIRPVKLGGKLPPRMGLRRQFGMRAFTLGEGVAK